MSSTVIVTPATFEPVSISDVNDYLRIDTNDEASFLTRLITTSRIMLERNLRRALCTQTLESILEFDMPPLGELSGWLGFTSGKLELPYPPCQNVVNVSLESQPGTWSVLDPSTYYVDTSSQPGSIWVQATAFSTLSLPVWTVWSEPFYPRIKIRYTAGYISPATCPQEYKQLLFELIAYKYLNREGQRIPDGIVIEIEGLREAML